MNYSCKLFPALGFILTSIFHSTATSAQLNKFIDEGKVAGNFHLRYESVNQDNLLKDAQALTMSSKLSCLSGSVNGFSALVEIEDVRIVLGVDRYSVGPAGFNPGRYSVIADAETTELDQGLVQFKDDSFTAKIGRQVIVYDNHRFVGHVGWRQDRQTFDALSFTFTPIESLNLNYNYLDKRNRIFAEDADIDSKDHLLHADYSSPIGLLTAYAYLLEEDNNTDNSLDTYGLRLAGSGRLDALQANYLVEFASQKADTGQANFNAEYLLLEGGLTISSLNTKIGYEALGSDSGAYGFSTPLSTLHAHNGWADLFLGTPIQGLVDTYLNVSGKAGAMNWSLIYHDFSADDSGNSIDDLGSELDLQLLYPISENHELGMKYASYTSGDALAGKLDTDKFWFWFRLKF